MTTPTEPTRVTTPSDREIRIEHTCLLGGVHAEKRIRSLPSSQAKRQALSPRRLVHWCPPAEP